MKSSVRLTQASLSLVLLALSAVAQADPPSAYRLPPDNVQAYRPNIAYDQLGDSQESAVISFCRDTTVGERDAYPGTIDLKSNCHSPGAKTCVPASGPATKTVNDDSCVDFTGFKFGDRVVLHDPSDTSGKGQEVFVADPSKYPVILPYYDEKTGAFKYSISDCSSGEGNSFRYPQGKRWTIRLAGSDSDSELTHTGRTTKDGCVEASISGFVPGDNIVIEVDNTLSDGTLGWTVPLPAPMELRNAEQAAAYAKYKQFEKTRADHLNNLGFDPAAYPRKPKLDAQRSGPAAD